MSNYALDVTAQWPEKRKLLAVHKSQFHGERLKRVETLVAGFARVYGRRIGVTYGEGVRATRLSGA